MEKFSVKIWHLMILVSIIGMIMGAAIWAESRKRATRYQELAERYALLEKLYREEELVGPLRPIWEGNIFLSMSGYYGKLADHYELLRKKYQAAMRRPLLPIAPDPPRPRPPALPSPR